MTSEELSTVLMALFGSAVVAPSPGSWQIETPTFRLLVLLSDDASWLRLLIPIAPADDIQPFLETILEANFDATQETRYGLHQGILWGIFQHSFSSLSKDDLEGAVQQLIWLQQQGIDPFFNQIVEDRVRQIVRAAKQQGQSMEATLQTLDRFYEEGMMGDIGAGAQAREETLAAWRRQLERFWQEAES